MKRVIVFANGALSHPEKVRAFISPTDLVLCADGGANHALEVGAIPHRVIGDLDSLTDTTLEKLHALGIIPERHPIDKDATDLELALMAAIDEKADEIVVVTALGNRLDHLLANIYLLTDTRLGSLRVSIFDGDQTAYLIRSGESLSLMGNPHETISLIPITSHVSAVTLSGVQWPLTNYDIVQGASLTVSNRITDGRVDIHLEKGLLLLVHLH